jgi:hypothetical protein
MQPHGFGCLCSMVFESASVSLWQPVLTNPTPIPRTGAGGRCGHPKISGGIPERDVAQELRTCQKLGSFLRVSAPPSGPGPVDGGGGRLKIVLVRSCRLNMPPKAPPPQLWPRPTLKTIRGIPPMPTRPPPKACPATLSDVVSALRVMRVRQRC